METFKEFFFRNYCFICPKYDHEGDTCPVEMDYSNPNCHFHEEAEREVTEVSAFKEFVDKVISDIRKGNSYAVLQETDIGIYVTKSSLENVLFGTELDSVLYLSPKKDPWFKTNFITTKAAWRKLNKELKMISRCLNKDIYKKKSGELVFHECVIEEFKRLVTEDPELMKLYRKNEWRCE